jgi:hypothetical protein
MIADRRKLVVHRTVGQSPARVQFHGDRSPEPKRYLLFKEVVCIRGKIKFRVAASSVFHRRHVAREMSISWPQLTDWHARPGLREDRCWLG